MNYISLIFVFKGKLFQLLTTMKSIHVHLGGADQSLIVKDDEKTNLKNCVNSSKLLLTVNKSFNLYCLYQLRSRIRKKLYEWNYNMMKVQFLEYFCSPPFHITPTWIKVSLWSVDNFPSNKLIRSLAKPGLIMKEDKISNEIFCIILQSVILQIYLGNENIKYQWNPIDSLQDNCKLNNRLCDFIFFQVNKELSISPLCNLLMASVLQFLNFSV